MRDDAEEIALRPRGLLDQLPAFDFGRDAARVAEREAEQIHEQLHLTKCLVRGHAAVDRSIHGDISEHFAAAVREHQRQ